ncbi:MAG: hypothetical protein ABIG61_04445 [Planctomycetota bacterium]
MKKRISIDAYLEKIAIFADDEYGRQVRDRFADNAGRSELAMLAAPSREEMVQLQKAVAIMTDNEKGAAEKLSDEQIEKIAADAKIDVGIFAIFMNGYALYCKRVS